MSDMRHSDIGDGADRPDVCQSQGVVSLVVAVVVVPLVRVVRSATDGTEKEVTRVDERVDTGVGTGEDVEDAAQPLRDPAS